MARFRNTFTGSVVSVSDEKSGRFTTGWEPIEDEKPKAKPRAKQSGTRSKKSDQ